MSHARGKLSGQGGRGGEVGRAMRVPRCDEWPGGEGEPEALSCSQFDLGGIGGLSSAHLGPKSAHRGNGCVTHAIERRTSRSEGVGCGGRCERVHVRVWVWRQDTRDGTAFQEGSAEIFAGASLSPRTNALTRRARGEFVEGKASPRDGWIRRRSCRDDSSHAPLQETTVHHVLIFSRSKPLSLADFSIFAASSPQMKSGDFSSFEANSKSVRANPSGGTTVPGMSTTGVPMPTNPQLPHVTH